VEGKQRLGSCGVELRQIHQCRTPQRPCDVSILPAGFGASLPVAVKLDGTDERDVAHLACEWNPVVGEIQPGGELLQIMVLAGAHVTAQRDMERSVGDPGSADLLDRGESVEHPQIDIMRIGLRDLVVALLVIGERGRNLEYFEFDRLPLPGRIGEGDFFRHW
jgi:hypothetical protein